MSTKEIEKKLAKLMDEIPEIEGLIAYDEKGKIISGQTITEMDNDKIAKKALELFSLAVELGETSDKQGVTEINLSSKEGNILIQGSKKMNIMALVGKDASHSIALIVRSLRALI